MNIEHFLAKLPKKLPDKEIIEANRASSDNKGDRHYKYMEYNFEVPSGVFMPGGTSRVIHDRLYDGTIKIGKTFIAMGTGCGVEPVIAASRGAKRIYAVDSHAGSVRASEMNFHANIRGIGIELYPIESNLFGNVKENAGADLIVFNPPTVDLKFTGNKDVIRNVCTGSFVLVEFFSQILKKKALDDAGEVIIVMSNTSDLKYLVEKIWEMGFNAEILEIRHWDRPYEKILTHLFSFRKRK